MPLPVYPVFPGLDFGATRDAIWSTDIQTTASGIEYRRARWSYPAWEFGLRYEVLRERLAEFSALVGFFNSCQGPAGEFLFRHPDDHTVTGQLLGMGDGATRRFQFVRSFGGFIEPFRDIKGAPVVRVDGVATTAFSVDANGGAVFTVAPPAGASIESDFSYYFRCRFLDDRLQGTKFADRLWETGTITLKSLKW